MLLNICCLELISYELQVGVEMSFAKVILNNQNQAYLKSHPKQLSFVMERTKSPHRLQAILIFFVMRTVTSAYIPNIDGHINMANTTYKLTGIVYFNGMHY